MQINNSNNNNNNIDTAAASYITARTGIDVNTLVPPTLCFGEIQMGLPHSEADIKWRNLLPQDQKVFDQKELSIDFTLQEVSEM